LHAINLLLLVESKTDAILANFNKTCRNGEIGKALGDLALDVLMQI
jgi:hypothetical protein